MKIILSILFILLFITGRSQASFVDSIITKESLEFTVSALSNDSMKGRFTAFPETKKAAEFIAVRFQEAGLNPLAGNDAFFDYYPLKFKKNNELTLVEAINVLGAIKGIESPDTVVIFSAHYDHIGEKNVVLKNLKDSIYNGANDNASGVALLIELAKYYTALKINRYTIIFVAFSGEELGLLGSAYTASNMNQSLVHAVINFDMVGRPADSFKKNCMVIAENSKPIIKKLNAEIEFKKDFFVADRYPEEFLFTRSDHYSFNKVVNRIFFTASAPKDQYYHTLKDELETIDFDFLFTATKNIAIACKIFLK
jgi:Zn-dependent M28 family amino/carboxypeptidase